MIRTVNLLFINIALVLSTISDISAQTERVNNNDSKKNYSNLYKEHDYSINIVSNGASTIYYCSQTSDIMACKRNSKKDTCEYICQLKDDNGYYVVKINNTNAFFYVDGLSFKKKDYILFTDIKQQDNELSFEINYHDKKIASCYIKLPNGSGNFIELFSDEINKTLSEINPEIKSMLRCIFFEIFDIVKENAATKSKLCYEHMNSTAFLTLKYGIFSYGIHHTKGHNECSFFPIK